MVKVDDKVVAASELPVKSDSKKLKLALKLLVTALCIWYISYKIDFSRLSTILQKTKSLWLFLALLSFLFSKLLSSFRLNIYFRQINIHLTTWANIKLYWLGMFFNLFLPGSISGDGYKIVRLTKSYGIPYKKTAAAVLLDRFSGLLALGILSGIFWLLLFTNQPLSNWIVAALVAIVPLFYLLVKFIFPYLLPAFWPTFAWGMLVQVFQVFTMFFILKALAVNESIMEYNLIFLISSVIAVLPFTIGGLGAREMVFLWGAHYFGIDNDHAVAASVLFYGVTVIASSFGLYYVFKDPLRNNALHGLQ